MKNKFGYPAIAIFIVAATAAAISVRAAGAANVSGSMSYRGGAPADKRQLHFENRVTSDLYVAPTTSDGAFSADLPPGLYDLRAERGVILKPEIRVDDGDVNVGHVVEPAPLDVRRPFEHESVAHSIVVSPAPVTANLAGRPIMAMRYGHEAVAPMSPPGTPVPRSTPLGEATPVAVPSAGAPR